MTEPAPLQFLFATALGAWAVPQAHAEEVVELGTPREVPLTPPHVRGLLVLRGEVLPVIDLDVLRGGPAAPPGGRGVLLRTSHGALVLIVRKVLGFERLAAAPAASAGPEAYLGPPVALARGEVRPLDPEGLGAWLEAVLRSPPPCP